MSDLFKGPEGPQEPTKSISRQQPESIKQTPSAETIKEKQPDIGKSKVLYQEAIDLIKNILSQAKNLQPINLNHISQITEGIINQMMIRDTELLDLANNTNTEENYLYAHSVNVLVLSIEVGLALGYNKSRLNELSMGASLHDIGMVKVIDLATRPRRLIEKEYDTIKQHTFYGVELLEKIKGLTDVAIYVAREHHERIDGSGYPHALKNGHIKEYSRLIGLVDTYEALTHTRAYRKKSLPHEAIKELLKNTKPYDSEMIKALINRIGIYPVGSWVELNTGEIAKLLELDRDSPLRPMVNIVFDNDKKRLENTKTLNLKKQYNIYIKRPLGDDELRDIMQKS